jgi:hypothetical protein
MGMPAQNQSAHQATTTVAKSPPFICIYGASKIGKTTDCIYAFPDTSAFYFAHPAALKPSLGVVGVELHPQQVWEAPLLQHVTDHIPKLPKHVTKCIVDDFSLLVERTVMFLGAPKSQGGWSLTGFDLWGMVRKLLMHFRDVARDCGKLVVVNCHEAGPKQDKRNYPIRGGPSLPSDLGEKLAAQCDKVLRAVVEPSRDGPWKGVYRCTIADPAYISGDRDNKTPDMAPMNLGEIIRASGYPLTRASGMEWMEELVEWGAVNLIQYGPDHKQAILQSVKQAAYKNTQNTDHVLWALRDSIDRSILRRAQSAEAKFAAFGV